MSALPPKADMCGALANVCFGPKADISPLIRSPSQHGRRLRNRLVFSELNVRRSSREGSFKPPFGPAVSAVLSGATYRRKSFSKIGWASPLVCSLRNRRPLNHRPAADRARKGPPLVTGIFVLGMRDRHWCATPQTHGLNELVLRLGLTSW